MEQYDNDDILNEITDGADDYKYGFHSAIDTDIIPAGLSEDVVRLISAKKGEPQWLLDFRLKAFRHWLTLTPPTWAHLEVPEIDFQAISYYAAPRKKEGPKSLDEVDPEVLDTFNRLGIPLAEQHMLSGMAVDAVMDSVSVKTTHKEKLAQLGIVFVVGGAAACVEYHIARRCEACERVYVPVCVVACKLSVFKP